MSNLFDDIEQVDAKIGHGWCTLEKMNVLASIIVAIRPHIVLELGTWAGRSALPMALALRYNNIGKLIVIDPWDSKASAQGMAGANLQWWSSVDHEDIYRHFIHAIGHFGVSQLVDIRRAKSDDVEPPQNIGVLHIDGNHSDQAIRDVRRFAPNVILGGFVFCDDIQWEGNGVSESIQILQELGFRELYKLGTGALYQRLY